MTQIVLRYPESGSGECAAENSSSLVLLEFQGKFETEQNGTTVLAGMEAGRLVVDNIEKTPCFYIGNQKLIGKEVKLAKPLAIIRENDQETDEGHELEVAAVIRKKIIFDSRPITIMK